MDKVTYPFETSKDPETAIYALKNNRVYYRTKGYNDWCLSRWSYREMLLMILLGEPTKISDMHDDYFDCITMQLLECYRGNEDDFKVRD